MASKQRDRVLELLRNAAEPMDAHQLAEILDIHVTTVRFHLSGLADEGHVRQQAIATQRVGRPRIGYVAMREPSYGDLVALMAGHLGGTRDERARRAQQVGHDWAATVDLGSATDACDLVVDALARLGFQTLAVTSSFGTHTLTLCTCPLAETARRNPEVARGIQQGLVQGFLDEAAERLGTRHTVDVAPAPAGERHGVSDTCRVHVVFGAIARAEARTVM
ncbi:helix-turn-helix transcriptional regulator [Rhodococcus gannanensis]|uniref:Helix-turn-helix transcriptional regulator n=1 Tax=Rhodococcus gannanensis TaxID=1960308 RepID=A0ABW4P4L3_9NOCA